MRGVAVHTPMTKHDQSRRLACENGMARVPAVGPCIYGYRLIGGRAYIHAQEALIVQAILTAPPRKRAAAARDMLSLLGFEMSELTLKSRITEVLRLQSWYEQGKSGRNREPDPKLILVSVTYDRSPCISA